MSLDAERITRYSQRKCSSCQCVYSQQIEIVITDSEDDSSAVHIGKGKVSGYLRHDLRMR